MGPLGELRGCTHGSMLILVSSLSTRTLMPLSA